MTCFKKPCPTHAPAKGTRGTARRSGAVLVLCFQHPAQHHRLPTQAPPKATARLPACFRAGLARPARA